MSHLNVRSSLARITIVLLLVIVLALTSGCRKESYDSDNDQTNNNMEIAEASLEKQEVLPNSEVQVIVKNCCGVEGAATVAADTLRSYEFDPVVANAQHWSLHETWIVYREDSFEDQAIQIRKTLGVGRILCEKPSRTGWDYEGDILVAVGLEWANANMLEEGQLPYTLPNPIIIE